MKAVFLIKIFTKAASGQKTKFNYFLYVDATSNWEPEIKILVVLLVETDKFEEKKFHLKHNISSC